MNQLPNGVMPTHCTFPAETRSPGFKLQQPDWHTPKHLAAPDSKLATFLADDQATCCTVKTKSRSVILQLANMYYT